MRDAEMRKDEFFFTIARIKSFSRMSVGERERPSLTRIICQQPLCLMLFLDHTRTQRNGLILLLEESNFHNLLHVNPYNMFRWTFFILKLSMCNFCHLVRNFFPSQATDRPCLTALQQIPDNHTMLNHTTLLFTPNLPGIKRNVNKFALIITQLVIPPLYAQFSEDKNGN